MRDRKNWRLLHRVEARPSVRRLSFTDCISPRSATLIGFVGRDFWRLRDVDDQFLARASDELTKSLLPDPGPNSLCLYSSHFSLAASHGALDAGQSRLSPNRGNLGTRKQ